MGLDSFEMLKQAGYEPDLKRMAQAREAGLDVRTNKAGLPIVEFWGGDDAPCVCFVRDAPDGPEFVTWTGHANIHGWGPRRNWLSVIVWLVPSLIGGAIVGNLAASNGAGSFGAMWFQWSLAVGFLWGFPAWRLVAWLDRKQVDAGRWGDGISRVVPWTAIESFSASQVHSPQSRHMRVIWANCGSAMGQLGLETCNWSEPAALAAVTALTREFIERRSEHLERLRRAARAGATETAAERRKVI